MGTHVRVYLDAADRSRKEDVEKAQFLEFEREARDGVLDRLARRSDMVATKQAAISSASHPYTSEEKHKAIAKEILPFRPEPVKSISNDIEHGGLNRRGSDALRAAAEGQAPPMSTGGTGSQRGFGSAAIADVISPDRFKATPMYAAGRAGPSGVDTKPASTAQVQERKQGGATQSLPPPPPPPPPAAILPPPSAFPSLPSPPAMAESSTLAEVPDLVPAARAEAAVVPGQGSSKDSEAATSVASPWRQAPELSAVAASPPLQSIPKGGSARKEAPIPLGPSPQRAQVDRGAYHLAMGAGNQEEQTEFDPQQAVQDNLDNFEEAGRTGDYSYLAVLPTHRPFLRRAPGQWSPPQSGPGGGSGGVTRSGGREKPPRPGLASPASTIGAAYVSLSAPGATDMRSMPRTSPGGVEHEDWAGPAGMPVSMSEATPGRPVSPARLHARELAARLAAREASARRAWAAQDIWAEPLVTQAQVGRAGRSASPEAALYGRVAGGRMMDRVDMRAGEDAYAGDDEGEEGDGEEGEYEDREEYEDEEDEDGPALDWSRLANATAEEVESSLATMTPAQLNLFLRTLDPQALHAAHTAIARARVAYRQDGMGIGRSPGDRVRGQPSRAEVPVPSAPRPGTAALPPPSSAPSLPMAYTPAYLGGDSDESEAEQEGGASTAPGSAYGAVEDAGDDSEAEPMSQQQLALFKRTLKAQAGADALLRAQAATEQLEARQAALLARTGGARTGVDLGLGVGWDDSGHLSSSMATPSRAKPGSLSTLAYDEYCLGRVPQQASQENKKEEEEEDVDIPVLSVPGATPGNYLVVDGRRGKGGGAQAASSSRIGQDVDDKLAVRGARTGRAATDSGTTAPQSGPATGVPLLPGRSPLRPSGRAAPGNLPALLPSTAAVASKGPKDSKGSSAPSAGSTSATPALDTGDDEGELDLSALLSKGHGHAHGAALEAALARLLEDKLKGSQGGGGIDMDGDDL